MEGQSFPYGTLITLKPNAEVVLSEGMDSPPRKWIEFGIWAVDDYFKDSGMLNINLTNGPYPGAYCSWVHGDDVKEVIKEPEKEVLMAREHLWEGESEINYGETAPSSVGKEKAECVKCGKDLTTPEERKRGLCYDCMGEMTGEERERTYDKSKEGSLPFYDFRIGDVVLYYSALRDDPEEMYIVKILGENEFGQWEYGLSYMRGGAIEIRVDESEIDPISIKRRYTKKKMRYDKFSMIMLGRNWDTAIFEVLKKEEGWKHGITMRFPHVEDLLYDIRSGSGYDVSEFGVKELAQGLNKLKANGDIGDYDLDYDENTLTVYQPKTFKESNWGGSMKYAAFPQKQKEEVGLFSLDSDAWFDSLAMYSKTGKKDSTLEEMHKIVIAGDFSSKAFKEFYYLANELVEYPFKKMLVGFMDNMMGGVYDEEFGAFGGSEYSMIGELFSLFRQGYKYY